MIEFRTKFDESLTKAVNKRGILRYWWILLIFVVLFAVLGAIDIATGEIWLGTFYLVVAALFVPFVLLLTFIFQKSLNKSMSIMSGETEAYYAFTEDGVTAEIKKGSEYEDSIKATYSFIYKGVETKTHYLLYISKAQCIVIPKSDIINGSLEELNSILAQRLGNKFKGR